MRNKTFVEYVWLDGYDTPNLRSKVKVLDYSEELSGPLKLKNIPEWNFDGSSTRQAPGDNSECILKPVRLYKTPDARSVIVLCEVFNTDDTPHITNMRSHLRNCIDECENNSQFWWGFEQEYFMMRDGMPIGFPKNGFPKAQGEFYCAAGSSNVKHRDIAEYHMYECLDMGIEITGINAEVALGQWEYQCFSKDTLKACDDLWMSRYLLHKMTEQYAITIDISPKPVKGDWNGAGAHTNFSTRSMREGYDAIITACESLGAEGKVKEHMAGYGIGSEERLTGAHETQRFDQYNYGVSDRGASVRIPWQVHLDQKGYIEDRRPNANMDPYVVTRLITNTCCEALAG